MTVLLPGVPGFDDRALLEVAQAEVVLDEDQRSRDDAGVVPEHEAAECDQESVDADLAQRPFGYVDQRAGRGRACRNAGCHVQLPLLPIEYGEVRSREGEPASSNLDDLGPDAVQLGDR
jgi:hypothetical protein